MADSVSDTFTGILRSWLTFTRTDSQEVGSVVTRANDTVIYTLADGSSARQVDLVYAATRAIPANTVETLDLLSLTQPTLGVSVPYVFRQVRLFRIVNKATASGSRLLVGCDPARPTAVYAADVGPSSEWSAINYVDSWPVTSANSTFAIANPSSEQITYSLYILGTSVAP